MAAESRIYNPIFHPLLFMFQLLQWLADKLLSPNPPPPNAQLSRPKIAVIGAGITGVTSAAHCVGHGFDVVIFEAGGEENVGGIWSKVNNTSSLQIHSLMYRFHPSVKWQRGYPTREQIVEQVRSLWKRYGLDTRTKFHTKVDRIYQDDRGRWIVNNTSNGHFDGVIAAVGTCGAPKIPANFPGMSQFHGKVVHSSQLTAQIGRSAKGKTIAIIGGGASAVEALEFAAAEDASKIYILSRSDKWIIPRNPIINALLSLNIFGQETFLSWIPELLLRKLFYRDLQDIAPPPSSRGGGKGLFTDTPMVNSSVMDLLRSGRASWVRCDIEQLTSTGVRINRRSQGTPHGGPGTEELIKADIIVMATGFHRPSLNSFLPKSCFQAPYSPPNWYLQTFPPTHPSICAINSNFVNAIGTVGNWHIGIYTRILLMFLIDPLTRPRPFWMRRWIDMTRLLKYTSPVGPFEFFTYLELLWWFVFCVAFNPFRWKWALFVFFGLGIGLPKQVVQVEDRIRGDLGMEEDNPDVGIGF